jgi:hypothetical protein
VNRLQRGRILVAKVSDPAGDATRFEFAASWGANFWLADGDAPVDSGELLPGSYALGEVNLPAGWVLTSAVCSDGSQPAAISLAPGETVTCTFTNFNPPEGSITIVKEALPLAAPAADVTFDFSGDLGSFQLAYPSAVSRTFADLDPGRYVVAESLPPGNWVFDSVSCDAASDWDWSYLERTVTIDLAQGEAVVCTFHNVEEEVLPPTASLTIIKEAIPADDTFFDFDAGALGTFTLQDPGAPEVTFTELEAGAYTITELDVADWSLAEVECAALDWSVSGNAVTVNLMEGEAAACTFHNEGELPFTGLSSYLLPMMGAGWTALLLGLLLVLLGRRRARV